MASLAQTLLFALAFSTAAAFKQNLFFSSFLDTSNLSTHHSKLLYEKISQIFFPNFFLSILYHLFKEFSHLEFPISRSQLVELAILNISYLAISIFFSSSPCALIQRFLGIFLNAITQFYLPGIFGFFCSTLLSQRFSPTRDRDGPMANSDELSDILRQLSEIRSILSTYSIQQQEIQLGSSKAEASIAETPALAPTPTINPTLDSATCDQDASSSDQHQSRSNLGRENFKVAGGGGGGESSDSSSSSTNISSLTTSNSTLIPTLPPTHFEAAQQYIRHQQSQQPPSINENSIQDQDLGAKPLDPTHLKDGSPCIPPSRQHPFDPSGVSPGGFSAPRRFCNHCLRSNHNTSHCWLLLPQRLPQTSSCFSGTTFSHSNSTHSSHRKYSTNISFIPRESRSIQASWRQASTKSFPAPTPSRPQQKAATPSPTPDSPLHFPAHSASVPVWPNLSTSTDQAQFKAKDILPDPYFDFDIEDKSPKDLEGIPHPKSSKETQASQVSDTSLQKIQRAVKQSRPAC